jgi:protein-tyrosine kinase
LQGFKALRHASMKTNAMLKSASGLDATDTLNNMSEDVELVPGAKIDLGKKQDDEKGVLALDFGHGAGEREEAAKLVSRIFLQDTAKRPCMVTFSAIEGGGGAGRICAAIACILAEAVPGEVCVLNANFEGSSYPSSFWSHERKGLRDVLLQDLPIRQYALQLQPKNLWLLPGGPHDGDLSQILHSEKARARLLEFRAEFQHVLISAPAVTRDPAVTTLGQLSDGLVLVIEAHATRREVARKVKENLEQAHVKLLGAVLNNRRFPIPSVLYDRL